MVPTLPLSSEGTWPLSWGDTELLGGGWGVLRGHDLALRVLRLLRIIRLCWWGCHGFTFSPLPSLTCSRMWPQVYEDSWWNTRPREEVAVAGEPADQG